MRNETLFAHLLFANEKAYIRCDQWRSDVVVFNHAFPGDDDDDDDEIGKVVYW